MGKRSVIYVSLGKIGRRNVKRQGAQRSSMHFDTKNDAISFGRHLAKKADLGQLKIQKRDGTFQKEYTYGKDPLPPEG